MTAQEWIARRYAVEVETPADPAGAYRVVYTPRDANSFRPSGDAPALELTCRPDEASPRWLGPEASEAALRGEIERDAAGRIRALDDWLGRLRELVGAVRSWAGELGWATREIDKPLEDAVVGKHRVPALVMQEGVDRVLLDPTGRASPGTQGVVDLYSMPAWDDVATLYHYDGGWRLHYAAAPDPGATTVRDLPSVPLSKETLREALERMRQHAAQG